MALVDNTISNIHVGRLKKIMHTHEITFVCGMYFVRGLTHINTDTIEILNGQGYEIRGIYADKGKFDIMIKPPQLMDF